MEIEIKIKKKNIIGAIFIFSILFSAFVFAESVFAYGGATVSWVAPTTDQGGGALTGLTGYRVYYSTSAISCTNWNAASQATRQADSGTLLPATYQTVSGGSTLSYAFGGTVSLTPGTAPYNFAVVAYDDSGNLSNCATGTGGVTSVSKVVSYSADADSNYNVNYLDYGIFHPYYNTSNSTADFDKSGLVDYLDYNILHNDYGDCFSTGCP